MSIREVAKLAGVSMSTVSRVVHDHPSIATETARSVRDAMAQLRFTPSVRRSHRSSDSVSTGRDLAVAFLVIGASNSQMAPAFHHLLRGVSDAAALHNASLVFSFVSEKDDLPPRIATGQIDGLLLHGQRPSASLQGALRHLPTVWLMANRQRPLWGDQVMPNNPVIGELAARHLVGRGHKHVVCMKAARDGWSLRLRAWAFAEASAELGMTATVLEASETFSSDMWEHKGLAQTADCLVDQLLTIQPRPTGVFILEDRLLPTISAALAARGIQTGPGGDIDILSCNNERPHLGAAQLQPASIDIRADLIGHQGVKQLLWRMKHIDRPERASLLVEPRLVEPSTKSDLRQ